MCHVPLYKGGKRKTVPSKHFLGEDSADGRCDQSPLGPGFFHPPLRALAPRSWHPCSLCPGYRGPCLCSCLLSVFRLTGLEESAWGDEEDMEHNYYNSIPGKEPPLGGLVDSRLTLTQPCALGALGAVSQVSAYGLMGEGRESCPHVLAP